MNGAHDCGGMMGFGPVVAEADEPVFHARWEARMFALMSAAGDVGGWTLDEDRAACEAMEPGHYITSSYYEHWLAGLEILLSELGIVTADELDARTEHLVAQPDVAPPPSPRAVTLPPELPQPAGHRFRRAADHPPRFQPGDVVVTP